MKTWRDGIEQAIPKHLHLAYRAWRVLREHNAGTSRNDGRTCKSEAVKVLVHELGGSVESARRALRQGEGIFWSSGEYSMYLKGYRNVYARFGVAPGQVTPHIFPNRYVSGNVSRFRAFVAALNIAHLQDGKSHIEIRRGRLCAKLGISVPTLHKYAKTGWFSIVPVVRPIMRVYDNGERFGHIRQWITENTLWRCAPVDDHCDQHLALCGDGTFNHSLGYRSWRMADGSLWLVQQKWNSYSSVIA